MSDSFELVTEAMDEGFTCLFAFGGELEVFTWLDFYFFSVLLLGSKRSLRGWPV